MRFLRLAATPPALLCLALGLLIGGCSSEPGDAAIDSASADASETQTEPAPNAIRAGSAPRSGFYTVDHYDESRDPAADLKDTVRRAQDERKRILLQVGGDWCGWCARISNYMETSEAIHQLLKENYLVMKVTYPGGEHTERFLAPYPKINAYPHLFVLESDGTFLHSQGTGELEKEQSYDERLFQAFLVDWRPAHEN